MATLFTDLALIIALILAGIAAIACLRLHRRCIRQQRQLAGLNRDLDRALRCLNDPTEEHEGQKAGFQESLAEASISVQLRQGGLAAQPGARAASSATEKYRHVATLADHGLSGAEIAGVLNISATEAEQVLMLARCA